VRDFAIDFCNLLTHAYFLPRNSSKSLI
jgi:hypothetical protein